MDKELTLEQLREEVQRAIRETSARAVARELVVSPTGLIKFADNPRSTVYGKTYKKLVSWYRHRRATRNAAAAESESGAVAAAVDVVDS